MSEIRNDHSLQDAVKAGDLKALLNSSIVMRLMDDAELARAVERYRDELFGAVMDSVPFEFREEANVELAKLRGMPVKEFLEYTAKRTAALEDQLDTEVLGELDSIVEQAGQAVLEHAADLSMEPPDEQASDGADGARDPRESRPDAPSPQQSIPRHRKRGCTPPTIRIAGRAHPRVYLC